MSPPPLSVVISFTDPWPGGEPCLRAVVGQARAAGAEVIAVASAGRNAGPPEAGVRWDVLPGASTFALRARGTDLSSGDVVAFTEDHVIVAPDWCAATLRAHAEHPAAGLVGGAVGNGSTRSRWDQANYLASFAPFAPPLCPDALPCIANCSFKRSALPAGPLPDGWLELGVARELHAAGLVALDERIAVVHHQSRGIRTVAMHFHNGRCCTGIPSAAWPARRRVGAVDLRHDARSVRTRTWRAARRCPPAQRRALVRVPLLVAAHVVGGWVGLAAGAGRSPP